MAKKIWPRHSIADIFDNRIVYRNLIPLDDRIPDIEVARQALNLAEGWIPRKAKDPEYADVILFFLAHFATLDSRGELSRVLYLGNRQSRDQATLGHFRQSTDLTLFSFLCEEDEEQAKEVTIDGDNMLVNRWEGLADLAVFLHERGFPLDAQTAIIVDLDKTVIAARGRNSWPLNRSRVEGVKLMVQDVLGARFEEPRFQAVYGELNQPKYHFFTEDNQDYVTYVSLMASALVYPINDLLEDLAYEKLTTFREFLAVTRERLQSSPQYQDLWPVYEEVAYYYALNDPTVFKSFRHKQYESTLGRLDMLPDGVDEDQLLQEEIVMTREVFDFLQMAKKRGVNLLTISDRPDESLLPSSEMAARGYKPIHKLPFKVVGAAILDRIERVLTRQAV